MFLYKKELRWYYLINNNHRSIMISKHKEKAINLRKKGYSYSEILEEVSVAKSTLSLWLRNIGLAKKQKQNITKKRIEGALRGANTRKIKRIDATKEIKDKAKKEIKIISERDLWLIGTSLHWAEGAKEKEYYTSVGISFSNSDYKMILIFLKWLKTILKINDSYLIYELYVHETADIKKIQKYWSKKISIPINKITIYLKRNKIKTIRKNTGDKYNGLIRIKVRKSSNLNRRISGWIDGIYEESLK